MSNVRSVGANILEAFRVALDLGRYDVANHLLAALEALEPESQKGPELLAAYKLLNKRPFRPRPH